MGLTLRLRLIKSNLHTFETFQCLIINRDVEVSVQSTLHFLFCINEVPDQRRPSQAEVKSSVSYSSVLVNIGKCLLVIILVPPFLNYASLQREAQMLLPKGSLILKSLLPTSILCFSAKCNVITY